MTRERLEAEPGVSRLRPDVAQAALALGRQGKVFDLGLEINEQMPQGPRGQFVPFSRAFSATPEGTGGDDSPFSFAAEVVAGTLHTSTHIDALVHVQAYGRVFGGARASDCRTDQGWQVHGAETIPPIIARSLLLDIPGMRGEARLPDQYEITVADLAGALAAASLELRAGDVVLVRTGIIEDFVLAPGEYGLSQPGVGAAAAVWLYERGMSVLGTDTTSTEPVPFVDPEMTTHRAMLVDRGVHLIENLYLDELAREGVTEALFICLPLKFTGATGSWVRPVAIV